jgi:histidinol-phosphatase (PHP family)
MLPGERPRQRLATYRGAVTSPDQPPIERAGPPLEPPSLPPDDHTHSEWSWDADAGSMEGSCARALELGLPSIAFTEHVDVTRWIVPAAARASLRRQAHRVADDGRFDPPALDVEGYLASVARCRERFPQLRIVTGVEVGEPHWFAERTAPILAGGSFERVLGSLHSIVIDGQPWLMDDVLGPHGPPDVTPARALRGYLHEALELVQHLPDEVQVLAHVDYPVRAWPGPFEAARFEEEYRVVLAALAGTGRALEVNTRVPLASEIVGWWRDVGGRAVSFGSDAHRPDTVADGFAAAVAMVEHHGFRADRHPNGFWRR